MKLYAGACDNAGRVNIIIVNIHYLLFEEMNVNEKYKREFPTLNLSH